MTNFHRFWHIYSLFLAHNGTLLFTSIDAHRGCDPSFRADLEILLYNLMYWITGSLPWTDSLHSSDEVLFNVFFF